MSTEMSTELRFTPQQEEFLSIWGEGVAVLAGAGSGKSTALVEKCLRLLAKNPEARFCAVSFTEKSSLDLERKLALGLDLSLSELKRRHAVGTIHQLCLRVALEHPRSAGLEGEERVLDDSERAGLWEKALESLWSGALPEAPRAALERVSERESADSLIAAIERVRTLRAFRIESKEEGDGFTKDLLLLSDLVLDRYARLKRARSAIDYDDMEKAALQALEDPRVRALVHRRYDLVLVDEAQDTNPLQAQILEKFAKPGFSNLVWVGDPKQSIYGFRDADVRLFEEIAERMPKRVSFTRNFRSRPGILDFVNEVSGPLFEAHGLRYEKLEAVREASESTLPVEGWRIREPKDLARVIGDATARGVRLGEMALLLRKIRGNEKWLKALEEEGVKLAISGGGPFWEDPRVRELVALLRAWISPAYGLSAAVWLRAPWVGVADLELDAWAREEGATLLGKFLATDHPLARILTPLRSRVLRPGELLLALLEEESLEAELGIQALGLWHRAEALSSEGLSFAEITKRFTRMIEVGKKEAEVPPPHASGVLPVYTIHSSKGLEFEHVLLLDFQGKSRTPNMPLVFFDRDRGIYVSARDENGERDKKHPVEAGWRKYVVEKELRESLRVFYVALTRAKERLLLAIVEKEEEKAPPAKGLPPLHERLDWRAWVLENARASSMIEWRELPSAPPAKKIPEAPQAKRVPTDSRAIEEMDRGPELQHATLVRSRIGVTELTRLSLCARQVEWSVYRPRVTPLSVRIDPDEQRKLGTEVHRALETIDEAALKGLESKWGPEKLLAEPLLKWVRESPSMDPKHPLESELSFEVRLGDEILIGAMDRVVEREGFFEILDFKILSYEKADLALLESYQDAMRLYAWALEKIEPRAEGKVRARLIAISPETVREIDVPLLSEKEMTRRIRALLTESRSLANGALGIPRPGKHCRHCPFREGPCEAAQQAIG